MDRLEEIKLRDAEHQGLTLIVHEDRRWLIGEIERWQFGYTEASNDRDRERDKWIVAESEIERLRAQVAELKMGYEIEVLSKTPDELDLASWKATSEACAKLAQEEHREVERLREALEAAESQIHYLKKELVTVNSTEVERLRAALQSIENFTISPYHPAILARRALAGEE